MRTECQPFLATDKPFSLLLSSRGRCGNSELGEFLSLPVNLLARTSEMFILEQNAPAISAGGFVMIM